MGFMEKMCERVNILGIKYTKISYSGLMEEIEKSIADRKITASIIAVDPVMVARKDNCLKKVYNSMDYVLADGMPIVFASKLLGNPLPGRITGLDLFPDLIKLCSKKGYSAFFLGSDEKTVRKVKKKLGSRIKASHYCPPIKKKFDKKDNEIMINKINKAKPDVLFIILGAPKQDIWMYKNSKKVDAKVTISIGAAFDCYAGKFKRAPKWMQNTGLEWLFRLVQNPKLWKRYARDMLFPFLVAKELLAKQTKMLK